jgi:hypothetical protein
VAPTEGWVWPDGVRQIDAPPPPASRPVAWRYSLLTELLPVFTTQRCWPSKSMAPG